MLDFIMSNEILTIVQIILCFMGVVLAYRFYGKIGLYMMAGVVTLFANLEVANCTTIFGLAVSLGNVSFVANNLIQDCLNENEGGEDTAKHTVWLGFLACIFVMIISQVSIRFTPNEFDTIHDSFEKVFNQFSIVTFISLGTFLISNRLNVKLYALFSKFTEKVWIRSQASTWISQLVDSVVMTIVCAVFGVFAWPDVIGLIITTYIVKGLCMVMEIPFLYWTKKLKEEGKVGKMIA